MTPQDFENCPSPAYIIDEKAFLRNLDLIEHVQRESGAHILLALKGFSMWKTFGMLKGRFIGATASGLYEAKLCREELGNHCHVYSPAYKENEIDEILSLATRISFNSFSQWDLYHKQAMGANVSAGIRVNPGYSPVKTDLYNPSAAGSRLGIPIDTLPEFLLAGMDGIHTHVLCESNSYHLEALLNVIEEKLSKWLPKLKWLNLGGGHLMTHKDYDTAHVIGLIKKWKTKYPNLDIVLEPGSAFAWQTGVLVSNVVDIVNNGGRDIAILDVSFTAHMPDCLEMPYQPEILGAKMVEKESKNSGTPNASSFRYWMGGNTCLAGDHMGEYAFDRALCIGDKIVFYDMIHYTTVKTHMFNGVPHPTMGMRKVDGSFEEYRVFGYEDYKNRMS